MTLVKPITHDMYPQLIKNIDQDDGLRRSFNRLALATFDISFQSWWESGWWTDRYRPYALIEGRRVVANASVNLMDLVPLDGRNRRLVQIGTVMTDPNRRNRGLARRLMEAIVDEWGSHGLYLFANDSVLDFYPKFGFQRRTEYQHFRPWTPQQPSGRLRRLDVSAEGDLELLRRLHRTGNPWSALASADNFGLLMFHCVGPMRDSLWYAEDLDAAIVAIEEEGELLCFDAFGDPDVNLTDLLSLASGPMTTSLALGFSPRNTDGWSTRPLETDEALFLGGPADDLFSTEEMMLPLLSHA